MNRLFRLIQFPRMETAVHFFLVSIIAWMALIFRLPGDTFTNPSFRVFAAIGTENQWSFWLGGIAAVASTGMVARNKLWVMLSLIWIASTHGVIALCFYLGINDGVRPTTPGVSTYTLIACLGYYLFWFRLRIMV